MIESSTGFRVERWVSPRYFSRRGGMGSTVSRALGGTLLALMLVFLGACASKPPKDIKLQSEMIAAADINPNRRGTPQPVKVHVYYLKQDDAFQMANFRDLIDPAAPTIASELIRREERLVGPGEQIGLDSKFDPETRFIGVIAEFTQIENAQWRSLVSVPKDKLRDKLNPFSGKKLMVALNGTTVRAEVVED